MEKTGQFSDSQIIRREKDRLIVPDNPTIPYIEGDGIGADIWRAAKAVLNTAVQKAYNGKRSLGWMEVLAGEKAVKLLGLVCRKRRCKPFERIL